MIAPNVCGAGFVLALLCNALITVLCSLHLAEEERDDCFTLFVFLLSSAQSIFLILCCYHRS